MNGCKKLAGAYPLQNDAPHRLSNPATPKQAVFQTGPHSETEN